jgi:hypothetical protein
MLAFSKRMLIKYKTLVVKMNMLIMLMLGLIMNFYVMWKLLWALLVSCLCWK